MVFEVPVFVEHVVTELRIIMLLLLLRLIRFRLEDESRVSCPVVFLRSGYLNQIMTRRMNAYFKRMM